MATLLITLGVLLGRDKLINLVTVAEKRSSESLCNRSLHQLVSKAFSTSKKSAVSIAMLLLKCNIPWSASFTH
jgi:hypothetical protein